MRSTTGKTYKVVVWATGGVGRYAIRTAADRPNLELVGAWVHSAAKDGQDVGTLAGIDPLGVTATRDVEHSADFAAKFHCRIYSSAALCGRAARNRRPLFRGHPLIASVCVSSRRARGYAKGWHFIGMRCKAFSN